MSLLRLSALGLVLIAPLAGGLMAGIDRKLTARMQGRMGPPILQPFYDVGKLFAKEPVALNTLQILYVFLHLAFMILTLLLLALGQDLLMALFAHAFAAIALILAAMCVRSPYSRIGAQRKIMQILAYEPILVLLVVGTYLTTGSFLARSVVEYPFPLLAAMPLGALAYFGVLLIKMEKSPFDVATSHHAHQELVKGITTEISGPYLALVEIAHFYEAFILFGIIPFFVLPHPVLGGLLALVAFLGALAVDNLCARVRTTPMVRFFWTLPMAMCLSNVAWLYLV